MRIDSEDRFIPVVDFGRDPYGDAFVRMSAVVGGDGSVYVMAGPRCCSWAPRVLRVDGAGTVTPIYQFKDSDGTPLISTEDISWPSSKNALTLGSDGALYGTTIPRYVLEEGGWRIVSSGTVFRIDMAGNLDTLHTFAFGEGQPFGLNLGSDGALYGLTLGGGPSGQGTLFRIDSAGNFATVHLFDSGEAAGQSWPDPRALTVGAGGVIYGTTDTTVFRVGQHGCTTP